MKRIFRLTCIAIATAVSGMAYGGTPIKPAALPEAARIFLSRNFPADEVWKAEKESGRLGMEYEVDLRSGAEVDFYESGDWKEVKAARGNAVPAAVIPAAIERYVSTNFKGQLIVEISRKRGVYEVELTNGIELRLTDDARPMPRL